MLVYLGVELLLLDWLTELEVAGRDPGLAGA
jgi:hypothetical protein